MDIKRWIKNKKIGVVYGGISSERQISIKTGAAIVNTLKQAGYKVKGIDFVSCKGFLKTITENKYDFVFIGLHGKYGEDGTVQSLLEMLKIPYSGSGVLASSLAMNKVFTKKILRFHNLPTPDWTEVGTETGIEKLKIKYPVVVKPVEEGSAIGVSIVRKHSDLTKAVKSALSFGGKAMIEQYIAGRELTVGILGQQVLPIIEIVPVGRDFYDFTSKYTKGKSKHIAPDNLPKQLYSKIQKLALESFNAVGCRAVSRIDFRLDRKNNPYILEINTLPGMTEVSLLPDEAKMAGIDFHGLVLKIIEFSLK